MILLVGCIRWPAGVCGPESRHEKLHPCTSPRARCFVYALVYGCWFYCCTTAVTSGSILQAWLPYRVFCLGSATLPNDNICSQVSIESAVQVHIYVLVDIDIDVQQKIYLCQRYYIHDRDPSINPPTRRTYHTAVPRFCVVMLFPQLLVRARNTFEIANPRPISLS